MRHVAAAVMWIAIAVMFIAFFGGAYLSQKAHDDYKLACFNAGGKFNMWSQVCEK